MVDCELSIMWLFWVTVVREHAWVESDEVEAVRHEGENPSEERNEDSFFPSPIQSFRNFYH